MFSLYESNWNHTSSTLFTVYVGLFLILKTFRRFGADAAKSNAHFDQSLKSCQIKCAYYLSLANFDCEEDNSNKIILKIVCLSSQRKNSDSNLYLIHIESLSEAFFQSKHKSDSILLMFSGVCLACIFCLCSWFIEVFLLHFKKLSRIKHFSNSNQISYFIDNYFDLRIRSG